MLEGLWTVVFKSNFGTIGSGTAVFIGNRILGGDSNYYYEGNVQIDGKTANVAVNIKRFNPQGVSIFGNMDKFSLKVSGEIKTPQMGLNGFLVEQPNMKISIECEKIVDLRP